MGTTVTIRGLIYDRFGSIAAFARKIGWSKQRLSLALKEPGKIDIEKAKYLIDQLGLEDNEISMSLFIPKK